MGLYPALKSKLTLTMKALRNKLHEEFARAIAEGHSPTEAYRRLSPSAKNPNTLGSRLWNRPDIRHRIAEISQEATEQSHLTIVQKRKLLEQQILGKAPTKVVVKPGGTELIYDTLGAIMLDSRMAGHLERRPSISRSQSEQGIPTLQTGISRSPRLLKIAVSRPELGITKSGRSNTSI